MSLVAANPEVRRDLVRRQREWAAERGGGVLEGRDIGTVVFPDAQLKVYLTARPEVRAERRSKEVADLSYEAVASDLARRDALDQGREASPAGRGRRRPRGRHQRPHHRRGGRGPGRQGGGRRAGRADSDRRATPEARRPWPGPSDAAGSRSTSTRRTPASGCSTASSAAPCRLARVWLRVEYHGLEHVPTDRPFILAPVHRSNIDFLLAAGCARRRQRFLAKDTLWKPGFGVLWSALGGIPVARGTADREALHACQAVVEAGEPLVMFPEGTRQAGPVVEELFDGPAFIQARTGAPIVPVGIGGSDKAMRKGAKVIRPGEGRRRGGRAHGGPETDGAKARRAAIRTQTAQLKVARPGPLRRRPTPRRHPELDPPPIRSGAGLAGAAAGELLAQEVADGAVETGQGQRQHDAGHGPDDGQGGQGVEGGVVPAEQHQPGRRPGRGRRPPP